jgi:nucleotide-binding universal stress UspA family protein
MIGFVNTQRRPRPRVIVGVDRSLHGLAALRAACAEAGRRGVPLYAVRVQTEKRAPIEDREIDAAFAEALGGPPPGLELHRTLAIPPVVTALVNLATGSEDLLVVGASRRRGLRRLRPGSVSNGCVREAYCAVLTVPAPELARNIQGRRAWGSQRSDDRWQRFGEDSPTVYR